MEQIQMITIARIGSHRTVRLAAEELRKYLKMIDPKILVEVRICKEYDESKTNLLWVGMDEQTEKKLPPIKSKKYDDAISIDVENFRGVITGANERAVLIAVYRFLKELGVRWLCPGKEGEVVPKKELKECQVHISEVPTSRFRVICNEGAVSYEHSYDIIDWMPKVGMNGYFIQFFNPQLFLKRWYSHQHNEWLSDQSITEEEAAQIHEKMREDLVDRSLNHYAIGHGWNGDPFGLPTTDWGVFDESKIPEKTREYLAMINGKRELYYGAPLNTNLCYSNPEVVSIISKAVADYCEEHPDITHIFVFLADQRNNFCECDVCRSKRPSDWAINLYNQIDEEMTRRGIETCIGVSPYNEISWPAEHYKLKNPERFQLVFAPITRVFTSSYADVDLNNLPELPPFELNNVVMPRKNPEIVALMKSWDDCLVEDRTVFDYHLWSTTFISDVGGFKIADVLSRDIKTFPALKLNGLISCQVQRYCFPTNIPMQVMADTLWDNTADFDTIANTYLKDTFGKEYEKVREYLETLSSLTAYWVKYNEEDVIVDDEQKENNLKGLEVINNARPVFTKVFNEDKFENDVQRMFWKFLLMHLDISEAVLKLQVRKFSGESPEERLDAIDVVANAYRNAEPELHRVLDVWRQLVTLRIATPIEDAH